MSFLDQLFLTGIAKTIKTPTTEVDVSSSEPALNQILKVTSTSPLRATWVDPPSAPVSSIFGRTGAVVAAVGDYVASKISNDSAVSGATTKDALNALAAAISSIVIPVTSVFGRTGAIVATLGDYVASKISNDSSVSGSTVKAALESLSAAITVSSVFGRTGAVVAAAGDYVASKITNDSTVTGTHVNDALDSLYTSAQGRSPYITIPVSPNAFDDEFSSGSADLATRGYTVVNGSTTLTRSGDIDPWNATGPVGNTYWSTLIGSWLFIQAAPGVQIDIYKTISLSAGDSYFARVSGTFHMGVTSAGRYNEVGLYGASGAALDNNNRVFTTIHDDTPTAWLIYDVARLTAGVAGGPTGRYALGGHDLRGVRFNSGTTHDALIVDSVNGEVHSAELTGCPASGTLTRFGIRNLFTTTTSQVPQIMGIDFIRKKSSNAWLIP